MGIDLFNVDATQYVSRSARRARPDRGDKVMLLVLLKNGAKAKRDKN